jgi:hypothetical protein
MDFYHDTLFAACGATLDGDSVNRAVKFVGGTYEQVCSGPVGIALPDNGQNPILQPNPACENVSIHCILSGTAWLSVHDAQGKLVHGEQLRGTGDTRVHLNVSEWSVGIYAITLQMHDQPLRSMRLVVER